MLGKWWTGSLCRYFEKAVLPVNPTLERALKGEVPMEIKPCVICGNAFPAAGRRVYCSERCGQKGQRMVDAKMARRYRQHKRRAVTV